MRLPRDIPENRQGRRRPESNQAWTWSIVGLLACGASLAIAQDNSPSQLGISPLGVRQQRVERMVEDLEQKFKSLKLTIQDKEPERAERLQQALNKAKELLLEKRMADVTRLLDDSQLDLAGDGQKALLADLRELLGVLLSQRTSLDDAQERLKLLSQWKREIQKLSLVQRDEKTASQRLLDSKLSPPRTEFEEHSKKQQSVADQAGALLKQMQPPGQSASSSSSQSQPGQANLSSAQQAMQAASQQLSQQDAANAGREQQRAIDELDQALNDIDGALSELADEAALSALADLEKRFHEMLQTQQRLTGQTASLEQKRHTAVAQLSRADRNAIRTIGDEERRLDPAASADGVKQTGLAGKAQEAITQLAASGAESLGAVVAGLRDDLITVGNALADDLRTDAETAARQKNIETTLEGLIEALKKAQAQKRQSLADAQAAGGNKPGPSGSAGKQSPQSAQGGQQGGGSKGIDTAAATQSDRTQPQNPWNQLRDKERDPVYSAIKEKFPARYQQLIEQYYRSFGDDHQK